MGRAGLQCPRVRLQILRKGSAPQTGLHTERVRVLLASRHSSHSTIVIGTHPGARSATLPATPCPPTDAPKITGVLDARHRLPPRLRA
jgi:hypothetical protein